MSQINWGLSYLRFGRHKGLLYLGCLFILVSFLFNKWFIETVFLADNDLESSGKLIVVVVIQATLVLFGAYKLWVTRSKGEPAPADDPATS